MTGRPGSAGIRRISTFAPGACNQQGVEPNATDTLIRLIAKDMAPIRPDPAATGERVIR